MEESLFEEIPTQKIYSDKMFWTGTFLGGPLIAGYFISENYKVFGEEEKIKKAWLVAVLATLLLFLVVFLIPEDLNIPNFIFPIISAAISLGIVKILQSEKIEKHQLLGGPIFGWGRVVLVSLIGAVITFLGIFLVAFSISLIFEPEDVFKQYGSLNHEIHYDPNNMTESEVDNIASAFANVSYFDTQNTKFVYVKKETSAYELSLPVTNIVLADLELFSAYERLHSDFKREFPNKKIVFFLVIDGLDNVVKKIE